MTTKDSEKPVEKQRLHTWSVLVDPRDPAARQILLSIVLSEARKAKLDVQEDEIFGSNEESIPLGLVAVPSISLLLVSGLGAPALEGVDFAPCVFDVHTRPASSLRVRGSLVAWGRHLFYPDGTSVYWGPTASQQRSFNSLHGERVCCTGIEHSLQRQRRCTKHFFPPTCIPVSVIIISVVWRSRTVSTRASSSHVTSPPM